MNERITRISGIKCGQRNPRQNFFNIIPARDRQMIQRIVYVTISG